MKVQKFKKKKLFLVALCTSAILTSSILVSCEWEKSSNKTAPTTPVVTPTNPPTAPENPPITPVIPITPVAPPTPVPSPSPKPPVSAPPIDLYASDLKPTEDNYFKKTPFNKPYAPNIYKEIYDRSFAVKFRSKNALAIVNDKVADPVSGTAWLFDYASDVLKNKVSLFFATNLHVVASETDKTTLFDYTNPKNDYLSSISLGKPKVDPAKFTSILNMTPFYNSVNGEDGKMKFFTNSDSKSTVAGDDETKANSIVGSPKIVFAGFDFMKNSEYSQFNDIVKKQTEAYLKNPESEKEDPTKFKIVKQFYNKNELPKLYKDFAIIQVDVNFNKIITAYDFYFKSYILKAMLALDNSIKRVKDNVVPNSNGTIPYISYDYASIQKNPEISKHKNLRIYDFAHQYVANVLIAGFPTDNKGEQWWARNNPSERINYQYKSLGDANVSATLEDKLGKIQLFNNQPFIENYGFNYSNLPYSSLWNGSDGSIGYSDYGLPIGIYSASSLSAKNNLDVSKSGSLTTFVQSSDIPLFEDDNKIGTIHAYNMIDGSNKTLYPDQKTSYRENLETLYGQDGIGPFKFKKTAIFPSGYEVNKTS